MAERTEKCLVADGPMRLDRALLALVPEASLRARRRMISEGLALVNGHSQKSACHIKKGDRIELGTTAAHARAKLAENTPRPQLLRLDAPYCFFYKPAGLHTSQLGGSDRPSLESQLGTLALPHGAEIRLLQRLDYGTSGIVCAALDKEAATAWRANEKAGLCHKFYLALLCGRLDAKMVNTRALDTARRRKTRLLPGISGRPSQFEPVFYWPDGSVLARWLPEKDLPKGPLSLALCSLLSGQRHQLRVHAADLGLPLAGDGLYGQGNGAFTLEQCGLVFPGHKILLAGADSLLCRLPGNAANAARKCLESKGLY